MTDAQPVGAAASDAVYAVPIRGDYLVYAPLHDLVALVNRAAVTEIMAGLSGVDGDDPVSPLLDVLRSSGRSPPVVRRGPVDPLFLGIIPTRGCNMGCRYCAFLDACDVDPMPIEVARASVDAYFDVVEDTGADRGEIHFFGGEPLYAGEVVDFVVGYARSAAAVRGLSLHLEISTNGFCSVSRARWLGDHFDTVVLSLDGPAPVHDAQRPTRRLQGTHRTVFRTARILSDSSAELVLRTCITGAALPHMAEWAETIADELRPSTVCFERLTRTAQSDLAGLQPPDPAAFAREFFIAAQVLAAHGIKAVSSTTDSTTVQLSCCPVGNDALIVSPDGAVNACYLLEEQWRSKGLELELGRIDAATRTFVLDPEGVTRVRALAALTVARCEACLSRFHCAGGCHVDHRPARPDDPYDDLCASTRLITVAQLLDRLDRRDLAADWLADDGAVVWSSRRGSDLLKDVPL